MKEERRLAHPLANQRGIVLVVSLLVMVALTLIGVAANNSTVIDTGIVSNYLDGKKALYIAEAGLERGKLECVQGYLGGGWSSFNNILRGPDGVSGTSDDGTFTFGTTAAHNGGTYQVRAYNDPGDKGGAVDWNAALMIQSTGSYRNASTTLRMILKMNVVPNFPGAVSLVGEAQTNFPTGGSYDPTKWWIDGRDWSLADTEVTGPTGAGEDKFGIAVCDISSPSSQTPLSAKADVTNSLSTAQKDHVRGLDYASGSPSTPSIGISDDLNKVNVRDFAETVKTYADTKLTNPPNLSSSKSTSGADNCISNYPSSGKTTCFGSIANPKITYMDKTTTSATYFQGNITGAGILVINVATGGNDRDVYFEGTLDWTGIVVVAGRKSGMCLY
jgi:hypothetical protein